MPEPDFNSLVVPVRPWVDPLVDEDGHDPRSRYVETFWLGVLGPTATWLLRRLAAGFDEHPDGFDLDLTLTAQSMGLGFAVGRSSPFTKALQRCVMFGLAHQLPAGGLAVRRRVPAIAQRHLRRMPEIVQHQHADWDTPTDADRVCRAHRLAVAMIDAGDEPGIVEHQLLALGFGAATAAQVADNMARLALVETASSRAAAADEVSCPVR